MMEHFETSSPALTVERARRNRVMRRWEAPVFLSLLASLALPLGAAAETVNKTFPFDLDKWYDVGVTEGPVTIHRVRVARQGGMVTKSKIFRPGNSEYLDSVQIQVEYSNTATRDWKADLRVVWTDDKDLVIDGYNGSEQLDERESFQHATVSLSTFKYGLEKARRLRVEIVLKPE